MDLYSAEKNSDPINNSYIISNLKMESDNIPPVLDQEINDGEIIFDNSFDDNLSGKIKTSDSNNYKNKLKKIQSNDKRLHFVEYKIKKNENLWSIAKKANTTVKLLVEVNNLLKPQLLKENDLILIPSKKGIFYKIRKGDTLTEISQKFNTEVDVIALHNNIDGRKIFAGKTIFLPDAENQKIAEPLKPEHHKIKKHENDNTVTENIAAVEKNVEKNAEKNKEKKSVARVVLSWPLHGPITSGFGIRTHPFSGDRKFHCGLDIGAEVGTVVRSAGDGTVIFSGWKEAYGNMIVISHKNNYLTVYAHNSKLFVTAGEKIKQRQKIALSGKTGAVTGAHLHFEIRKGIVPLNPLRILK